MDMYPSKFISMSSCIIFVKSNVNSNYEILLLKRSPDISFSGFYTFPGGKIEK